MPATEPFLREVMSWRRALQAELLDSDGEASRERQCNLGQILGGLLFLRLAQGRNDLAFEAEGDAFEQLLRLLRQWDLPLPDLQVSPHLLTNVVAAMQQFPVSPTAEILGRVHERFTTALGVRKANGVFYSPPYIVRAILARTLPSLFQNRTPFDTEKVTILDPSCGCGSFLLGACDWLFQWHLNWYLSHGETASLYKEGDEWRLIPSERARIVREHLYGVDIDAGAVEVARLSLLLKVMEQGEALPDVGENIRCGNSLTDFDWDGEFAAVMARGGFDAVVGNPPYSNYSSRDSLRASYQRSGQDSELAALQQQMDQCAARYADCSRGCKDLYKWFTARSLELTRPGGTLGFIIPNTWLAQPKYGDLKRKLLAESGDLDIIDLGTGVFPVVVPTCIVIARKGVGQEKRYADLKSVKDKATALEDCAFQPLQDNGRIEDHPLVKRYLMEWPAELRLHRWLTLREGQHIPRASLKAGHNRRRFPIIDSKNMGRYEFHWNPRYSFGRSGNFRTTQGKRIVVRKTGDAIVAALTPSDESFVLQSLYQGVFLHESLAPEYVLGLLNSKFLTFIYQNAPFGQKGRVMAQFRKGHLDALPLPEFDLEKHDHLVELVTARLGGARNEDVIDHLVYELYGLGEEEIALIEGY